MELRLYQGFVSDMYYSTLVSDSLVVDLQAHLAWVVEQLQERLGIQSSRIPDIYLAGSTGLFEVVSEATGREVGFEDGYYSSGGSRPGIYMRTDFFRTRVQRLLTHEYLHLVRASWPTAGRRQPGLMKVWPSSMSMSWASKERDQIRPG